ncbi:hypothetical protein [Pseudomonas phage vB_Pa-PAC2]
MHTEHTEYKGMDARSLLSLIEDLPIAVTSVLTPSTSLVDKKVDAD